MQQQQQAEQAITDADLPERPKVKEVAAWLRLAPNTIYSLAKKGEIPCRKVGRGWLFDKAALLKWARPETGRRHETI